MKNTEYNAGSQLVREHTDAEIWNAVAQVLRESGEPLSVAAVERVTGKGVLAALIRESGFRRMTVQATFGPGEVRILALV